MTPPEAETFALDAETNTPEQQALPGIQPPFNYERCYLELEAKAAEVDALHHVYEDAALEARETRKAWDKAAEVLTQMALKFAQRRREKAQSTPTLLERVYALGMGEIYRVNMNDVTDEFIHELEAWLLDAEQHPDERERWSQGLPRALRVEA